MSWEGERQRQGQAFNSQKSSWWEAELIHPLGAGWASTRCAKPHGRLSEAWERKVITFLDPVQTVLTEKDKFRDYCQFSGCLPMDSQRKWYIMLSNDWGQFSGTGLGLHCPMLMSTLEEIPKSQLHQNSLGMAQSLGDGTLILQRKKSSSKNWLQRVKPIMGTDLDNSRFK